jgi:hypothetical protein
MTMLRRCGVSFHPFEESAYRQPTRVLAKIQNLESGIPGKLQPERQLAA